MHVSHAHRLPACSSLSLEARLREVGVWAQQSVAAKKKKKRQTVTWVVDPCRNSLSISNSDTKIGLFVIAVVASLGSSLRDNSLTCGCVCGLGWGVGKIRKRI